MCNDVIVFSIIILNYNTKEMTISCVKKFIDYLSSFDNFEIILVDNNSSDGSYDSFYFEFNKNKKIILIKNEKNGGFGYGNNIGAKKSRGKYLIFANSDTIINNLDFEKIKKHFLKHKIGALGVKLLNEDNSVQSIGYKTPNILNEVIACIFFASHRFPKKIRYRKYKNRGLHQTGWVSGAFFISEKASFELVGGFDENIFMYAEDLDLCLRFSKYGYSNYTDDSQVVHHLHGKSSKLSYKNLLQGNKNYLYVIKKNNITKIPFVIYLLRFYNVTVTFVVKKLIAKLKGGKK